MPHIEIAAPPRLVGLIAWTQVAQRLHAELASCDYAKLHELKTRIITCEAMLAGNDPTAEHLAVTLIMTNPRSDSTKQAMAAVIVSRLTRAIQEACNTPVEVCVFCHYVPKAHYLKQVIPAG